MYPIGIAAPDGDAIDRLRDRLVERLRAEGRVATVSGEERVESPTGPDVAYRVGSNGAWEAAGDARDLDDVLDALAPDHDYAVVAGYPEADLPHVVVGEGFDGDPLVAAEAVEDVDPEVVLEALEGTEPHVTLESLVARAKRSPDADRAGAIATFTGRVRERDHDDDAPTTRLEFEKYEGVAEKRLSAIREELTNREGVQDVLLHHRTGVIRSGEDIVFVVVLAGHREEAFETVEDGIDRLKAEVPIFKKEVTVEDSFWVHERS